LDRLPILTCVIADLKSTCVEKSPARLPSEELVALREAAAGSGRSVGNISREAIRKQVLELRTRGSVTHWEGEPTQTAIDHDSVHDDV